MYGELGVAFGKGKTFKYIPLHKLVAYIGLNSSEALPIYAYTGCDTVSSFATKREEHCLEYLKVIE